MYMHHLYEDQDLSDPDMDVNCYPSYIVNSVPVPLFLQDQIPRASYHHKTLV